jgi:hypothetical protein
MKTRNYKIKFKIYYTSLILYCSTLVDAQLNADAAFVVGAVVKLVFEAADPIEVVENSPEDIS